MDLRPVDLSALDQPQASRWAVVWWIDGMRQERTIDDRALADAYAAAHRGRVVRLANLDPWPEKPESGSR
jgi:hypothetical protein